MANNLYFVPVIRRGHPIYRIPKYFWHSPSNYEGLLELQNVKQGHQINHKLEDLYLLVADLDTVQDAALISNSDVIKIPPLDNTIPNITVRNTVRDYMEIFGIPSQWVVVGMSYRTILRIIIGLWEFRSILQHFAGKFIFYDTLNLDKVVGDLSQEMRDALISTADALNLDYTGITLLSTIREVLYVMGQQFAVTEFKMDSIII